MRRNSSIVAAALAPMLGAGVAVQFNGARTTPTSYGALRKRADDITDADLDRIAAAESKRARKAAKRRRNES